MGISDGDRQARPEEGLRRYTAWLDRAFSAVTVFVVVSVGYFVVTERLMPALRGEPTRVHEGERLSEVFEFRPLDLDGGESGSLRLRLPDGHATLLLVFNSTCQACYRTLEFWRRAVAAAGGKAVVLAVALDDDRRAAGDYAQLNLPTALAVTPEDPGRFVSALGISVVPFTALFGANASLLFARQGSLDASAVDSLIRALGALAGSEP